jgi:hypothetical protein
MNLQLTSKTALFALGLFFSLSFAQEADTSVESRQKAALSALDSIEENVIGFAINGRAKGGFLYSSLESKALPDEEPVSEYSAFTNFLLGISIRPSNETKATFDLQFHKDWQSAYREGNNSPIIRWWSYDGNILNKKLKFNLGTMRIAYTPLTIYLPEPDLIMEPEIFSELKKDAMEERYLDGTNRRLLQGLNLEFATPAGIFDKIFLQGTIVRLRKVADGTDRISFDFDPNKDRFSVGARTGIETFGFSLGVNNVYTFNRYSSSLKNNNQDTLVDYEKNNVLSFELGYNSKKLLSGPVGFGIGAEYAISNWIHRQDKRVEADPETYLTFLKMDSSLIPAISAQPGMGNFYPYYETGVVSTKRYKYELSKAGSLDNKNALLANAFLSFDKKPFEAKLSGHFLDVDKDFESELAASPAYLPSLPILNSDATLEYGLEQFRAGSLENMYYSSYYTLPLNAATIVSGAKGNPGYALCIKNQNPPLRAPYSIYNASCLDNNYKLAHYYRNAYTQQTYTRLERGTDWRFAFLDPSVNMALPYGFATPDRKGGGADLNFAFNKAVNIRGVFGSYSSEFGDYTRFGGGLEINVARLAGLSKALALSGSYEQNKEENGLYNPQTDRIIAGAKIGIWRGLSLIGGFQQLSKEFKKPYEIINDPETGYFAVDKTSEILAIGGPQIKISERAKFSLQGGLLKNSISFIVDQTKEDVDLDKFIMSGIITVEF